MTRSTPIQRWQSGETITTQRLNELVDQLNLFQEISAGPGIQVSELGGRWIVELTPEAQASSMGDPENDELMDLTYLGDHNEIASTNKWTKTDHGPSLTVSFQTATAYNPLGDQKLYVFVRDFTFNSAGRLQSISSERRLTINKP